MQPDSGARSEEFHCILILIFNTDDSKAEAKAQSSMHWGEQQQHANALTGVAGLVLVPLCGGETDTVVQIIFKKSNSRKLLSLLYPLN